MSTKALKKEVLFGIIKKSIGNSRELIIEGKLLKQNNHLPRAYALFQLATEEVGKAILTYGFLLFEDYENPVKQKEFLNDFRDHKIKTRKSAGIDFLIAVTIENNNLKDRLLTNIKLQSENISEINNYKNYSLYTSLIDGIAYNPSEIISANLVTEIELYAEIRQEVAKQIYDVELPNFEEKLAFRKSMDMNKLEQDAEEFLASLKK